MKTLITSLTILICIVSSTVTAQTDWSKVDFTKKYKGTFKISGSSIKSLKANPTFINSYQIIQFTTMKGSNVSHSKGSAVFSEVSLTGIDMDAYHTMVSELHNDMAQRLTNAGLTITNGDGALATEYALKQISKAGNQEQIGNTGDNPVTQGKNLLLFQPKNTNVYYTDNLIKSGVFLQKLSEKGSFNLFLVKYTISFAYFKDGNGYKSINLSTEPLLSLHVTVTMITPNGSYNKLYYSKLPVVDDGNWSEGIFTTKERNGEYWGLSNSSDYQISANSDKYLSALKAMIIAVQTDIEKGIKSNF